MPKTIIADTSCLILLTNIGELDLLHQVYGYVVTTQDIATEYGEALPDWIEIAQIQDKQKQLLLELQIDKGEASALTLALTTSDSTVILDDYKARKIAKQLGISITGTIGVVIKAKLNGVIPSIKPYMQKIKKTNFRLSNNIEELALKIAKE